MDGGRPFVSAPLSPSRYAYAEYRMRKNPMYSKKHGPGLARAVFYNYRIASLNA